ncbi:hypothetical protein BV20DRAFT_1035669 [Pilatotrama ljubarskyi]|nr:hypothetical protein BV20DRAFT_1035669 [Pilatotrama ljubarskyi]
MSRLASTLLCDLDTEGRGGGVGILRLDLGLTSSARNSRRSGSSFGQPGSKICAAWGDGNAPSLANFKTPHIVGLYDWDVAKPSAADALGFEYWPMLWGGDQARINAFDSAVQSGLGTIVLGFNEPNEQAQSNIDPFTAATLWKQHIKPKRALGYKTCSPAVSNGLNGRQWMQEFLQACSGCTIDFQCLHWFDIGFESLETYLTENHDQFGLPIILTEFAEEVSQRQRRGATHVFAFMRQALQFFDDTDWIAAACPFGILLSLSSDSNPNALQNADGTPTALGELVINDGQ